MHILLRYYETTGKTRHEKVKETLETMGASILLGGLTTFIGVIPLAFSTTTIFMVVFKSFLAMVSLGCGVGLTLLPVLLSLVGPVVSAQLAPTSLTQRKESCSTVAAGSSNGSFQGSDQSAPREVESSSDEEIDAKSSNDDEQHLHLVKSASQGGGYEVEV